jgi:hypothetical protein
MCYVTKEMLLELNQFSLYSKPLLLKVLNTKNLALFENENVDALIKSINYKRFQIN